MLGLQISLFFSYGKSINLFILQFLELGIQNDPQGSLCRNNLTILYVP